MSHYYWRWIASWAAVDREAAFRKWQASGYADITAHDDFIRAYTRANAALALASIPGAPTP